MAAARAAGQRETLLPVSIFALLTSNGMLTARTVPDGCPSGTCVYHPSDTKYPDMVACCTSGTSCGFFTTCVPGTELDQRRSTWVLLHSDLRRVRRVRLFVDYLCSAL